MKHKWLAGLLAIAVLEQWAAVPVPETAVLPRRRRNLLPEKAVPQRRAAMRKNPRTRTAVMQKKRQRC